MSACTRCGRATTTAAREGLCARCQGKPDVGAWWNGEPCLAERGTVVVGAVETPTWWCAGMTGTRRRVVRVTYAGEVFYLDDEGHHSPAYEPLNVPARTSPPGEGWAKVTEGMGSPRWPHSSVPVDDPETWRPEQVDVQEDPKAGDRWGVELNP